MRKNDHFFIVLDTILDNVVYDPTYNIGLPHYNF